jgi:hypothetical protein
VLPLANPSALSALACAGGGAGYIALVAGAGRGWSIVLALACGLVAAYGAGALLRYLHRSTRWTEALDPRGVVGTVLSRITAEGVGEVSYSREGRRCVLPARSANGRAIEPRVEVIVLSIEGGIASVSRSSEFLGEVDHHE